MGRLCQGLGRGYRSLASPAVDANLEHGLFLAQPALRPLTCVNRARPAAALVRDAGEPRAVEDRDRDVPLLDHAEMHPVLADIGRVGAGNIASRR